MKRTIACSMISPKLPGIGNPDEMMKGAQHAL